MCCLPACLFICMLPTTEAWGGGGRRKRDRLTSTSRGVVENTRICATEWQGELLVLMKRDWTRLPTAWFVIGDLVHSRLLVGDVHSRGWRQDREGIVREESVHQSGMPGNELDWSQTLSRRSPYHTPISSH